MAEKEPSWDFYAAALLAAATFIHALQWPLMPRFLDIWYHVAVMKGFAAAGGYVTHAFWEAAPAGRAHLYPPFLHALLLSFYRTGLAEALCGRLLETLLWPALLAVVWHAARRLASPRAAFFCLLIASSSYPFYLAAIGYPAFTAALVFCLIALGTFEEGRTLLAGLWLAAAFYTHTQMALIGAASLILYAAAMGRGAAGFRSAAIALAAASPLLFHQTANALRFHFPEVPENRHVEIDVCIYALSAGALLLAPSKFQTAAWCLIISFLPMAFTHRARFFGGHGLLPFIVLATTALDGAFEQIPRRMRGLFLASVLILWGLGAPVLIYDRSIPGRRLAVPDRTLTHALGLSTVRRDNENTIYFERPYGEIVKKIRLLTDEAEIIWSDLPYAGGILGALAERSTSTAMLSEVRPDGPGNPMEDARVWVWFKDPAADLRPRMDAAAKHYGFRYADETELARLYVNSRDTAKRREAPRRVLPEGFLHASLAATAALGFFTILGGAGRVFPSSRRRP